MFYKIEIAQVVARRITKPQRTFSRFESHWLLFFIIIFLFFFGGEGGGLTLLFCSCLIFFFLFIFLLSFIFIPLTCIRYIY